LAFGQYFSWLIGSRSSPKGWQTKLQLCFHIFTEIAPARFISFAIRLDRDIINSEAGVDTGNLKLIVIGALLALILMISGCCHPEDCAQQAQQWSDRCVRENTGLLSYLPAAGGSDLFLPLMFAVQGEIALLGLVFGALTVMAVFNRNESGQHQLACS